MRNCPKCKNPISDTEMNDKRQYADSIMQELYRRQQTSDLCLDCIMEAWVAEVGKARLDNRAAA